MACRSCGRDNPAKAKFCIGCGARLAAVCAGCSAELPDGARFCPDCGRAVEAAPAAAPALRPESYTPGHLAERILTTRAALEGERKPVTVLFCDLVGSTALAERLGADAMHDLLNRFFELALGEVHRYEGTVNQFLGDGFMALFGAPLAHEDHARRAALAALGVAHAVETPLALADGERVPLRVRMGLNTGLVVVGAIGDNLRMDYTAVGDTTHLAARLQQAAAPGTILVSDATARLIETHVVLEPQGELQLRGLSAAVRAHRLVAPAARGVPAAAADRRARSRFVGREREAATLRALFADAEHGRGGVAGLVGDPGLGKSRLLSELRHEVGDRARWLEGRCLSYGATIPYLPVLDLVRATFGLLDVDTPEQTGERVRERLGALGIDAAERAPYVLQLLGVKEPDEALRALGGEVVAARTLETLRQVWIRESRRQPVLLVVEDLHWIDPASEAALAAVAESVGRAAILLVTTYRPGYRPPWLDRSYAAQIALAPLGRDDCLRVIESLQADLAGDGARAALILDRAEGNPFFLEELVHVVADGGGRGTIPDSVQGVLAARIDRLPPSAKQALQTAAVLGREFPARLLRAVADEPARLDADLRELARQEFLHERAEADEPAWIFKHALTQEVAHSTLVTPRRRALHRRAADALARLYPERVAELAPVLAHHYLEAEAWPEAAGHAQRAAEAARGAWANREAAARYDEAVRAAERAALPPRARAALLEARAGVRADLGRFDPAREDLEAALAIAREAADVVGEGRVLAALGALWGGHRDYRQGLELTRRAVSTLAAAGDRRALAVARTQLGIMLINLVQMRESRVELEAARALYRELGDTLGEAQAVNALAMNVWLAGDLTTGIRLCDEALQGLRAAGHPRLEIETLVPRGAAHAWAGRRAVACADFARALELARALEARSSEAFVRVVTADFLVPYGGYAEMWREATTGLAIARELDHLEWTSYALGVIGRIHAECGDVAGARALHAEQLDISRRLGTSVFIADALAHLGRVALEAGELDDARGLLHEAADTAGECLEKVVYPLLFLAELGLRAERADDALAAVARFDSLRGEWTVLALTARRIEAEAWPLQGRLAEAEAALARVARDARAIGAEPPWWQATVALGELHARAGRADDARRTAAAACAALAAAGAALPSDDLRRAFVRSRLVRRAHALEGGR